MPCMISSTAPQTPVPDVSVLAFDIFGTVVDWHGSLQREVEALLRPSGASIAGYLDLLRW